MKYFIFLLISVIVLNSCGTSRKTDFGYNIKGISKIVFREKEIGLNNKSKICGFVYSRNSNEFIENASVKIGNNIIETDKNGFFMVNIESGTYTITSNFIGNNEEKISNLKINKNERIMIVFKLGTSVIQCK